jgi:hypothetical protein
MQQLARVGVERELSELELHGPPAENQEISGAFPGTSSNVPSILARRISGSEGAAMKPSTAFVISSVILVGCDSSGTRLPAGPGSDPVTGPPVVGHTLYGKVTAAGRPAAGARVTVLETLPEPSATTDDNGNYRIAGLPTSHFFNRTLVRFTQPGYFTEFKRPDIARDTQVDIALDPLVFVTLGDVVRGTVTANDAVCAGKDYSEGLCKRFAVAPSVTGTLEVTLTASGAPGDAALDVVNAAGDAFAEFSGQPKRVSIRARAGETWEIRVVLDMVVPLDFELTTSMR